MSLTFLFLLSRFSPTRRLGIGVACRTTKAHFEEARPLQRVVVNLSLVPYYLY